MTRWELPFRQIHLDFHTSEDIPDVGADFDAEEFAATLEKAHVNSVTAFGRCHHGWIYFDSREFPERVHPTLARRDLLREQIEACHARGIRVPIYTTVQWDHYTSQRHPEWCVLDPDGRLSGTPPYEAGFYRYLCVNTPYREFLKLHVREMLETLPVDGFFFDIVQHRDCSCRGCRDDMEAAGLDPAVHADRMRHAKQMLDAFKQDMTEFVRRFNKDCLVFYNAGHVGPAVRDSAPAYTHFEVESLPSGGWGYIHFPLSVRYARTLGRDCLSHTGKFHTAWGDFHSFKNRPALEFECLRMLALNAKCDVGDQLHPRGRLCPHVYDLIGSVYSLVEAREPWCAGARAVAEIGVLTPEEFTGRREAAAGAVRILQEGARQFDVLDTRSDWAPYKLLVLPDHVPVDDELAARLQGYLDAGGRLIASFESGLTPSKDRFAAAGLGVRLRPNPTRCPDGRLARDTGWEGRSAYAEYVLPSGAIGQGLPPTEHVMYAKGVEVEAQPGTDVLAPVIASYFDRTSEHFCSHRQTPSSGRPDYPGIVRRGGAVYFAHPVFSLYNAWAPRWCRTLLLNAVDMLLPEPLLRHDGPTGLMATVNEQAAERRWIVHLLHYVPERRGRELDVIEDVIPLFGLNVSVKVPGTVRSVRRVPDGGPLEFRFEGGRVDFLLQRLDGHAMVELAF
ncbi:MAG: beta-galactosidase [Candidatus Brocadiaceae bacterium]|nr:beta-galactosidase [Candidatus Brocadiaceae bacterium]